MRPKTYSRLIKGMIAINVGVCIIMSFMTMNPMPAIGCVAGVFAGPLGMIIGNIVGIIIAI